MITVKLIGNRAKIVNKLYSYRVKLIDIFPRIGKMYLIIRLGQ